MALAFIVRKTVFIRQRSLELEYATVDHSAALEVVVVALGCLVILACPVVGPLMKRLQGTSGKVFLFSYVLGIFSALWSVQPSYSLYQAGAAVSQILLILIALSYCADFARAEKHVLFASLLALLAGIAVHVKFYGLTLNLRYWHTNDYTASAAMLACYCTGEFFMASGHRRKLLRRFAMIGYGAVALGTSAASIIATMAGLAVAALLLRGARWPLILLSCVLLLGACVDTEMVMSIIFPGKTVEQVESLRGRVDLWEQFVEFAQDSPIIGHGFAMGAKLGDIAQTNTHNAIFSVLLGTGAIGLMVVLVGVLRLAGELRATTSARRPGAAGCACALVAGLVNSLSIAYLGEAWRAPSLVFACILGLHLLFIYRIPTSGRSMAMPRARTA